MYNSCLDCPHHRVINDPDPKDTFNDDDKAVVCTRSQIVPRGTRSDAGRLLTPKEPYITAACRPYQLREETTPPPDWCSLHPFETKEPGPRQVLTGAAALFAASISDEAVVERLIRKRWPLKEGEADGSPERQAYLGAQLMELMTQAYQSHPESATVQQMTMEEKIRRCKEALGEEGVALFKDHPKQFVEYVNEWYAKHVQSVGQAAVEFAAGFLGCSREEAMIFFATVATLVHKQKPGIGGKLRIGVGD